MVLALPSSDARSADARRRARIGQALGVQVSPRDWVPFPKQSRFLACSAYEAMFGGSAGPGKSEVLVIGALRFIDRPDYSALLLRRKAADLDSLIQRAAKYYAQIPGVRMRRGGRLWLFPSGAKIKLGGAQAEQDIEKYNSEEYQYVGFDEATHFTKRQWLYMISRLRGPADLPLMLRGATNPGGVGHCVPHGDVLTPTGWRDIRTMRVGDPVFSVRPDGTLFETTVAQVHAHDYEGDLVEVNAGGLRMSCTPNHRVAKVGGRRAGLNTRTKRKDAFSLVPFEELPGQATILRSVRWEGVSPPDFELPEVPRRCLNKQPTRIASKLFFEFLGWFLSEGHVTIRRAGPQSFAIAQEKEAGRIALRRMLDACGFRYAESGHQFVISSTRWASYLAQFGKCRDKHIPAWVKASTPAELLVLFDALMGGDGHWKKAGTAGHYYTTSARLAEDVAEIAIKLGYCVATSERQRESRDGLSFEISVTTKKTGGTEILTGQHCYGVSTETKRRSDVRRVPFAGKVYCIGIEGTHSFVIRQRGSVWVSGNSWVLERFAPWLYPPHEMEYTGPRAPDEKTLHYLTAEGTDVENIVPPGTPGARSRAFFHASIADNPVYAGSEYEKNLDALPLLDRLRLKHGNWMARPAAGLFFKRHWFVDGSKGRHLLDHLPGRVVQRIRYWDLAGTEQERAAKGGAWTAGLLYAKLEDGSYVIEHVARGQWSPGEVESQIVSMAETDPEGTDVVIELDPGQAGKFQGHHFMRLPALAGYTVRMARPAGDKLTRARTPSAQSEQGNIRLMRGEWVEPFLREAESFPEGTKDQVDALSGAHRQLALVSTGTRTPRAPAKKGAQAPREGTSARRSGGF